MSASTQVMFGILFAFGYLVSPIVLIWGWSRWLRQPKVRTTPSILSLIGFILASAFALIAASLVGYAQNSSLSVLRSAAAQGVSLRSLAFAWRNRVWHQWCVATESAALARSRFGDRGAHILDTRGSG
jgi:tellurite resistance protein TehA-like permease